jgi:hypothetical protein
VGRLIFNPLLVLFFLLRVVALGQNVSDRLATPIAVVPFELGGNHIYLQARVNNSSSLSVAVDSGSPDVIFDSSRSTQLGLPSSGDVLVPSIGDKEPTPGRRLAIRSISLGGATLDNVAADSVPSLGSVSQVTGHATDAIIGSDLFNRYVVEVDYPERVLRLYDPDNYVAPKEGCQVPLLLDPYPKIHARLIESNERSIEAVLVLDTGSNYLFVTRVFGDAHPDLPVDEKTIEAASARLVSGVTPIRAGRVRAINLGGCVVEKPIALFLQDVGGSGLGSQEFSGSIGMNILQHFTTVFDYRHHLVTFKRNPGSDGVPQYNMTGIHVLAAGPSFHDFTIDYVLKNSPGAREGIQVGDKIEAVNYALSTQLTLDDLDKMFKRPGLLRLRISRNGKQLNRKLKLKPLI